MANETLLSLEARRALRDERMARIARRRSTEVIEAQRRDRAASLRAAETSQLSTELEVAATVIPNPHQAIPTPWSRTELTVLAAVMVITGLIGAVGGTLLTGVLAAAIGTGTLLLARRLACASLESGAKPRLALHGSIVGACALSYGFLVGVPLGGWMAAIAGCLACLLLGAAAVAFASPWLLRAREMGQLRELRERRIALERAAVVHASHAQRLRKEAQADAA